MNVKHALLILSFSLAGCSAVSTAVKHHDLETSSQMSNTVWLNPVGADQKTIFLQIRNTTDKSIDFTNDLKGALVKKGYTVVDNPKSAHYWVQANVIKFEKMDQDEAKRIMNAGFGGAATGAAVGALAMAAHTTRTSSIIGAGLIGSAVGLAADSMIENVTYSLVTDIQIVEQTSDKVVSTETASLSNGLSTQSTLETTSETGQHKYQTRILTSAEKMNLDLEEASPALSNSLAMSVSGVF